MEIAHVFCQKHGFNEETQIILSKQIQDNIDRVLLETTTSRRVSSIHSGGQLDDRQVGYGTRHGLLEKLARRGAVLVPELLQGVVQVDLQQDVRRVDVLEDVDLVLRAGLRERNLRRRGRDG